MGNINHLIIIIIISFGLHAQDRKYPEHFGDILNSEKMLLGKSIFRGDIGITAGKISFLNAQNEMIEFYRFTTKFNFNINPFDNFYIKNSFYFDLGNYEEAPFWLSNHFYQIGIYNWRNKTFSYGYENYQPNRFTNSEFDYWTNMKRGFFFVSYNYEFNKNDNPKNPFFFDESSKFIMTPLVRIQPEYVDILNQAAGNLRPILGTNLRYVVYKNIYFETGLFYYPVKDTQLPWDPDFTYGFGIFDWRAFKLNLSYGNWIANRFPWDDKEMKHGFMNGEFTLYFNYAW
jgi:hypothetical protein